MLTVADAAKRLNVSQSCLRAWIRQGKLRAAKLAGSTYRIPEAYLAAFVAAGEQGVAVTTGRREAPRPAVEDDLAKLEAM
jgi:excisionase family DNA binding protein